MTSTSQKITEVIKDCPTEGWKMRCLGNSIILSDDEKKQNI